MLELLYNIFCLYKNNKTIFHLKTIYFISSLQQEVIYVRKTGVDFQTSHFKLHTSHMLYVYSVKCEVWSVKFEVWRKKFRLNTSHFKHIIYEVWSLKSEFQTSDFKLHTSNTLSMKFGSHHRSFVSLRVIVVRLTLCSISITLLAMFRQYFTSDLHETFSVCCLWWYLVKVWLCVISWYISSLISNAVRLVLLQDPSHDINAERTCWISM